MNWLIHNPVADLPGPEFLAVYAALTVFAIVLLRSRLGGLDPTRDADLPPPKVPGKLSPLEVAYLEGKPANVLSTVLFDLWGRGYLKQVTSDKGKTWLAVDAPPAAAKTLTGVERAVYRALEKADPKKGLKNASTLFAAVKAEGEAITPALKDELLIMPDDAIQRGYLLAWAAAVPVLGVGGYKLSVALYKGHHNVFFLILLMTFALFAVLLSARPPRLTRRGKQYLEGMRIAFRGPADADRGPAEARLDPRVALGVALFGFTALSGSTLAADLPWLNPKRAVGGCGGGSSCSSSGCGGGAGGCGGGGCGGGGCGGGCGGCGS